MVFSTINWFKRNFGNIVSGLFAIFAVGVIVLAAYAETKVNAEQDRKNDSAAPNVYGAQNEVQSDDTKAFVFVKYKNGDIQCSHEIPLDHKILEDQAKINKLSCVSGE